MAARLTKRRLRSDWADTVLVCAKCSKKLDGGFGPKGQTKLAKALRKRLGVKKGRKSPVGIVETKCLDVCPKGAVTVVSSANAGSWNLVRAGSDLDAIIEELGLESYVCEVEPA